MAKYYSPSGNLEEWAEMPEGYYTVKEWEEAHPRPMPEPIEPTTEGKLAELDTRYNSDKNELMIAYLNAVVYDNTDLASDIKTEIEALDEAYDHDYEEIAGGGE